MRGIGLKMHVVAYDPFLSEERASQLGVRKLELDELLARADFITLHTPLTDKTRHIIDKAAIAKMKQGVRIINAARGVLIRDADLAEAIRSGKVAGAALDVFEPEPPSQDNPLIGLPGVIHTPHLAASTADAQNNVALDAAQLVLDALLNKHFANVCNPAVLHD
jgi:D-3-phosphoglycerate dehydrogenase